MVINEFVTRHLRICALNVIRLQKWSIDLYHLSNTDDLGKRGFGHALLNALCCFGMPPAQPRAAYSGAMERLQIVREHQQKWALSGKRGDTYKGKP